MRLIDADEYDRKLQIEQMKREEGSWGQRIFEASRIDLANRPTIPAVPLDKLCELCEEIDITVPETAVPCVLCEKIIPEWCKQNNHPPMTWDKEWKCPKWKQLLTKWMEGLE